MIQRYKRILGREMHVRNMSNQEQEFMIGCGVFNKMTRIGISDSDVRSAANEQVESLDAEFIEVSAIEDSKQEGVYAQEKSQYSRNRFVFNIKIDQKIDNFIFSQVQL